MANRNQVRRNRFIRVFVVALAIFSVSAALFTTVYVLVAKNSLLNKVLQTPVLKTQDAKTSAKDKAFTVVAIFGVEEMGARQVDTNMLMFFNHKNQEINLVSIPRDTKFNWPEDVYKEISLKRKDIPKIIPIYEVPSYVGPDQRNDLAVQVLENAFHMNIDYYINMDLAAFKYLIDMVGPVTYEAPMINYVDADKKLDIKIAKGGRIFNGEDAVGLVQYSEQYSGGDLNRIKVQQGFFKALVNQILKPENKVNIPSILKGLYPYIQTNFEDAEDYMIYLDQVGPDKIFTTTLPGSQTSDHKYAYDSAKSKELIEQILLPKAANLSAADSKALEDQGPADTGTRLEKPDERENPGPETNVVVEDVYDAKIMPIGVYNGTNIAGLAAKTKKNLEAKSYKVVQVGNYQTKPVDKTIIKVYTKEIGDEFLPYFPGAIVQVDEGLKGQEEEIQIILGLTERQE